MSNKVRYPLILALVCVAAGGSLSVTYIYTAEKIAARELQAYREALNTVLPEIKDYEEKFFKEIEDGAEEMKASSSAEISHARGSCAKDPKRYFPLVIARKGQETSGYAAVGAAQGYSSLLRVLVGFSSDLKKVVAVRILFQQETPGLGANSTQVRSNETIWSALFGASEKAGEARKENIRPWFQKQFDGVSVDDLGKPIKDIKGVDAITGATITSEAVRKAVLHAARRASAALKTLPGDAPSLSSARKESE